MSCAGFNLPRQVPVFGSGQTLDGAYMLEERRRGLADRKQQAAMAAPAAAAPVRISIQPIVMPGELLPWVQSAVLSRLSLDISSALHPLFVFASYCRGINQLCSSAAHVHPASGIADERPGLRSLTALECSCVQSTARKAGHKHAALTPHLVMPVTCRRAGIAPQPGSPRKGGHRARGG